MGKRPRTAAGKKLAAARDERRRTIHKGWAERHPERAAAERALRLQARAANDDWGHKQGTAQTHAQLARTRDGAIARLYQSGAIDAQQLDSAVEIAAAAERIGRGLAVRTMSLETRIDSGMRGDGTFFEALGQVRREVAYKRWCDAIAELSRDRGAAVLAMIVEDCGMTAAGRRYRMGKPRLRGLLTAALDLWPEMIGEACDAIDAADLAAMHAGLI